PRLWKYLLKRYLQVFFLSLTGFISILLVTRFQHIARFASMGTSPWVLLKFISYQIPFILPLAIPISCLISALLLFQSLSRSHELTALRVAGLGIFPIAFPLFILSLFIAMGNFTLASELAPKCKNLSKSLAYQMTALNPLA